MQPKFLPLIIGILWMPFMSCAPAGTNLPGFQAPGRNQIVVSSIRGEAFVFREDKWVEIIPGDLLGPQDLLRVTARSQLQLQLGKGAILSLMENTLFRLDEIEWSGERSLLRGNLEVGTVVSKVNKLARGSDINLRSATVSLGVRGTEFLLRRTQNEVLSAVASGEVSVKVGELGQEVLLGSGKEVAVNLTTPSLPTPVPLSDSLRETIARETQFDFLPLDEEGLKLVRFLVRTIPTDADIFMGDRALGRGIWGGVIKAGNQLVLQVRKGGYRSREVVVDAQEDSNPVYLVELDPLSPQELWEDSESRAPTPEEILRLQEASLAALRSKNQELEAGLRQQTEREKELTRRLESLAAEAADLNSRLNKALQERGQLQTQVQALTQERDQRVRELENMRRDLATSRTQLNNLIEARENEQRATNELIRNLRDQLEQSRRAN